LRLADGVIDFLALEKILDALGHGIGHRAAAAHDLGEIEFDLALQGKAVVAEMPDEMLDLRALEQRLGRDAAPVEAGAPGAFHFDAHHFFPELGRANRPDITRRAAANDNEIVVHKASYPNTSFVPEKAANTLQRENWPRLGWGRSLRRRGRF